MTAHVSHTIHILGSFEHVVIIKTVSISQSKVLASSIYLLITQG